MANKYEAIKIHAGKYEYRGHTIEKFMWYGQTKWQIKPPTYLQVPEEFLEKNFYATLVTDTIAIAKMRINELLYNKQNQIEENK